MNPFHKYLLQQEYNKLAKLGDRLAKADPLVNWEAFRPIITDLYRNDSELGGRPNADEVVMVKLLVVQQWYGLSDEETEREAVDRLSFRRFSLPGQGPGQHHHMALQRAPLQDREG